MPALLRAIVTVGMAAGVLAGAPALARAADGQLVFDPAKGTVDDAFNVVSVGPCPTGSWFVVRVFGPGLPQEGANINGVAPLSSLPETTGGQLYVPMSSTLRDFAADNRVNGLRGTYQFTIRCRDKLSTRSLKDYTGSIKVDPEGRWAAVGAARAFPSPAASATTGGGSGPAPSASGAAPSGGASTTPTPAASGGTPAAGGGAAATAPGAAAEQVPAGQWARTDSGSSPWRGVVLVVGLLLVLLGLGSYVAASRRSRRASIAPVRRAAPGADADDHRYDVVDLDEESPSRVDIS